MDGGGQGVIHREHEQQRVGQRGQAGPLLAPGQGQPHQPAAQGQQRPEHGNLVISGEPVAHGPQQVVDAGVELEAAEV